MVAELLVTAAGIAAIAGAARFFFSRRAAAAGAVTSASRRRRFRPAALTGSEHAVRPAPAGHESEHGAIELLVGEP